MVGGFVEQQRLGLREENARELHAPALASRERLQFLGEHTIRQPERCGHLRSLGVRSPAARRRELLIEPHVAFHRLDLAIAGLRGHLVLRLADAPESRVNPARRKNAIARQFRRIARVGVLRQIADLATAGDLTGVLDNLRGDALPRKQPRQSCLTGTVATDQSNPHSFIDAEIGVDHEFAGTDPHRSGSGR